jgi:hypothetical protein
MVIVKTSVLRNLSLTFMYMVLLSPLLVFCYVQYEKCHLAVLCMLANCFFYYAVLPCQMRAEALIVRDVCIRLQERNARMCTHETLIWPKQTSSFIKTGVLCWQQTILQAHKSTSTRKSVPKPIKEQSWKRAFGTKVSGLCSVCQHHTISVWECHYGHIVSLKNFGQDTVDNLLPVCASCNESMGAENLYDFQKRLLRHY